MAWKQALNALAVVAALLAVAWQLHHYGVLHRMGLGPAPLKDRPPTMNFAKLLSDLRDEAKQHAALSSAYTFAGNTDYALQLAQQGVHKELLQLVLGAELHQVKNEALPIALMTLGRITTAVDGVSKDFMAKSDKAATKAANIIRTGVPGWIAAVAQLTHALCRVDAAACATMNEHVLRGQEDVLVPSAMSLLEMGGVAKQQELLTSGCKLTELLLRASSKAREHLVGKNIIRLLLQVLMDGQHGSVVAAAVANALLALVEQHPDSVQALGRQGAVLLLVTELRRTNQHSMGPLMALLAHMVHDSDVREDMVSSGLLSICGQMLFQGSAEAGRLRGHCVAVLCGLADEPMDEGGTQAQASQAAQQHTGVACIMSMVKQDWSMPLHGAALDALRDMGGSSDACAEMVEQGVLKQLASLLSSRLETPSGTAQGWLMQAQRSAAVLVAMVALQPGLRPRVVEAGLVEALHMAIQNHLHGPELRQQLRVTAAAALVPILSTTDDKYDIRVMESGVLEPLAAMFTRSSEQEQQVAAKVLGMLRRNAFFKKLFEQAGIKLDS